MGTPLYMSPEQVEGKTLDPRSDIYSLGVTCYHMLAGKPPFEAETPLAIALQHLKSTPEPLEKLRPDLPIGLCRIVERMLAKQPEDRFASARDVLKELRALAPGDDDEEWPELLELLDPAETAVFSTRHQATQQLETAMHRERQLRRENKLRWARWLAGIGAAFTVGGVLAWLARDRSLLAGADAQRSHVSKRDTALDQYLYAATLNTEDAWLSVREFFDNPHDKYYVNRADQQLARLYLYNDDYERALPLFRRFAALPESEEGFRAFGLAGECVIYSLQGNHERSAQILAELYPIRLRLDEQLSELVELAITRNHQASGAQTPDEWRDWAESRDAVEG
jgi:serine/threonine-protein kinase